MGNKDPGSAHTPTELRSLVLIALAGVVSVVALDALGVPAFERFFGDVPALEVSVGLILAGVATLGWLSGSGALPVYRRGVPETLGILAIAALFPAPVIVVDLFGGFPETLNVTWPASALFYPVMALLAESAFHVLPLGCAYLVGVTLLRARAARVLALAVVPAALIEPIFQTVIGAGDSPGWATVYVALHVFVFNLLGLHALRRRGFVVAYLFRFTYYLIWHIGWGSLRLRLLFPPPGGV